MNPVHSGSCAAAACAKVQNLLHLCLFSYCRLDKLVNMRSIIEGRLQAGVVGVEDKGRLQMYRCLFG
jgi:hypothetical protein